jgi:hypothetical protein
MRTAFLDNKKQKQKTIKNEGCPEKQKYETAFRSKKPKWHK